MSYMAILRYGRELQQSISVFGTNLQICGAKLHDQLLSWPGDDHWPVAQATCQVFTLENLGHGMERRLEIHGPEKQSALRALRSGIYNG